jgi:hypothetical protein
MALILQLKLFCDASQKQTFLQYLDFDSQGIIYSLIFHVLIYILYDCFVQHSGQGSENCIEIYLKSQIRVPEL